MQKYQVSHQWYTFWAFYADVPGKSSVVAAVSVCSFGEGLATAGGGGGLFGWTLSAFSEGISNCMISYNNIKFKYMHVAKLVVYCQAVH